MPINAHFIMEPLHLVVGTNFIHGRDNVAASFVRCRGDVATICNFSLVGA